MGFSADWLALREPADLAARDSALLHRAATAAGPAPLIVDLGCGTGATWRAMAPLLPKATRWRFIDNDANLLAQAGAAAGACAELVKADLTNISSLPLDGATLVTASALLDLVSEDWVISLAARLHTPFYAALNFDGQMSWTPQDPRDAAITAAFNRDQKSDKGFGLALGPASARRACDHLRTAGFKLHVADSPWQLGPEMAALHGQLIDGIARAAGQAGALDAPAWARTRQDATHKTRCSVGHQDILALLPSRQPSEVTHAVG